MRRPGRRLHRPRPPRRRPGGRRRRRRGSGPRPPPPAAAARRALDRPADEQARIVLGTAGRGPGCDHGRDQHRLEIRVEAAAVRLAGTRRRRQGARMQGGHQRIGATVDGMPTISGRSASPRGSVRRKAGCIVRPGVGPSGRRRCPSGRRRSSRPRRRGRTEQPFDHRPGTGRRRVLGDVVGRAAASRVRVRRRRRRHPRGSPLVGGGSRRWRPSRGPRAAPGAGRAGPPAGRPLPRRRGRVQGRGR